MSNVIRQTISSPDEQNHRSARGSNVNSTPEKSANSSLTSVYGPVLDELAQVENTISAELHSESPALEELLQHSRKLGGKRLRPALMLLTAKVFGPIRDSHIYSAAALEMVHLATLIHDDVLDEAKTRRHKATAHERFGTKSGVLLGDYLFTHSFSVSSKSNSIDAVRMLAQASNLVCEGEIKQNAWQANFELSEQDYLQMVSEKTGELCAVACGIGASLAGASSAMIAACESFGRDLGVAFQIVDDVLDLIGDAKTVGKTLGTDLQNRKTTLPVIHCLRTLQDPARDAFLELLKQDVVPVEEVVSILDANGSIDYARSVARDAAQRSIAFTKRLPESESTEVLAGLGAMMLQRTH